MPLRQAYVFEAKLVGYPSISRRFAVAGDQTLEVVHTLLRLAFGWDDDHLYAFWLDGDFWGNPASKYAPTLEPEGKNASDARLEQLGLEPGQKIAYVFDIGDEWRVDLRVAEIEPAGGDPYPQLLTGRGDAPSQYGHFGEEDELAGGADDET
jgi:pRiA4b ORF-3-like protein